MAWERFWLCPLTANVDRAIVAFVWLVVCLAFGACMAVCFWPYGFAKCCRHSNNALKLTRTIVAFFYSVSVRGQLSLIVGMWGVVFVSGVCVR